MQSYRSVFEAGWFGSIVEDVGYIFGILLLHRFNAGDLISANAKANSATSLVIGVTHACFPTESPTGSKSEAAPLAAGLQSERQSLNCKDLFCPHIRVKTD